MAVCAELRSVDHLITEASSSLRTQYFLGFNVAPGSEDEGESLSDASDSLGSDDESGGGAQDVEHIADGGMVVVHPIIDDTNLPYSLGNRCCLLLLVFAAACHLSHS